MIREIKAVLPSNPGNGQFFKINIVVDGVSYNQQFTFKTTPSISTDILIGANVSDTIDNLFTTFSDFSSSKGSQYSAVQNIDGASLFIDAEDVDSGNILPWFNTVGFSVTHTTTSLGVAKIILSRSPYVIDTNASGNFDRSELELRIWTGNRTSDRPATATYALSKPVVQAGQDNIVFDIHKLVNDRVRSEIPILGGSGIFPVAVDSVVWVESDITAFIGDVLAGSATKQFLAIDGFGYHSEGFNPEPPKVLSSIGKHVLYSGIDTPLYFSIAGLTAVTANGFSVGFSFDEEQSNQNFAYINASAYTPSNGVVTIGLEYGEEHIRHDFFIQEDCSHDVINCLFKNRFGFWQSLPFAKTSRSGLEKSSEQYKGIVSSFGRFNPSHHNNKQFNTSGKRKHTLNTDYLPENYNQLVEELMLSEFVYLVIDQRTIPVEVLTKSVAFKTKRNDRMIQYTMEFEESYNVINQVI